MPALFKKSQESEQSAEATPAEETTALTEKESTEPEKKKFSINLPSFKFEKTHTSTQTQDLDDQDQETVAEKDDSVIEKESVFSSLFRKKQKSVDAQTETEAVEPEPQVEN